jgi:uncharacterized protein (TIGR02001 family)
LAKKTVKLLENLLMKKLLPLSVAAATIASSLALTSPAYAQGALSANVGFLSDYYFRGVNLGDAGAYAGVDYEHSGFYAGTWWVDDGGAAGNDGMETDFYFGYGHEFESGFSAGIGYTRYDYTYSSDYEHEINLSVGFGQFSLDYAKGSDEDIGKHGAKDMDTDYDFVTLSWSGEIFGVLIGSYDADSDIEEADYNYAELSASGEIVAGIDASFIVGIKSDEGDGSGTDDGYMVVDLSKSFDP